MNQRGREKKEKRGREKKEKRGRERKRRRKREKWRDICKITACKYGLCSI